ncbi:MAG: AsmA-like C-terminal region-containing protein, partial [Muribaculaceae bacterium]|nr:AsmA-like C-terminal region-containing protein [Muribaculaceae bacterium]
PEEKTSATASLIKINLTAEAPVLTQNDYSTVTLTPLMTIASGSANINGNKIACRGLNLYTGNINPADIRQLNLNLVADRLSYTDGTNNITARRPDIRLNIAKRATPYTISSPYRPSAEDESPESMTSLPHTPGYISVSAPGTLREFLAQYDFNTLIKCAALNERKSNGTLRDLSATVTPDRLTIHRFNTEIQSTRARIATDVSGLRDFLLDTVGVQPLYINLQTDLDTVNINTLAHAWFSSRGGVPQHKTTVSPMASDSIAYLIPRNITAHIKASAKETVYTNLHLYDLNTRLTIDNGRAEVNGLNISSDFGHAAMNLIYDTADIDSIGFKADLAITDVNIVNFFKNFHALLMMAPQMKNLDGNLSIYGSVGGSIFPDMVINVPGMYADFNLQGRQLKVHQSNFIRRVTKMMLIDNDDDLHIKDMNVFAHVHGNLLQLDPFLFEFDRYKLRMLGINNFNGDLYYQVGVIENPFHIPFGIKIEGLFHDPKLRFGSTDYDTQKALRISQSIMEQNNINIVRMMKGFMGEFLRKAAQAATDPNLSL